MQLLLDVMCGGIVSYLRMCGYDTVYAGDHGLEDDDEVLALAREADRTLITRDVDLAARTDESILLESREVEAQLTELVDAGLDLSLTSDPEFCGRCNGPLEPVPATDSTPEYAPDPGSTDIWRCTACGQYFWRGSHWDRVAQTLARIENGDGSRAG
ncbi:DUF5615 family PIN-like protein [Halosolutus amylolyticus]|uniref:DUF5615 family PIN-like protein n=1 Tax=Halosolutus amylolyticus TaxID=2932267 RepID=A0ABD5PSM0_9EURY|nr:Mut7-C RNAse domain-containing protein [Halosolutus amylolyticus]